MEWHSRPLLARKQAVLPKVALIAQSPHFSINTSSITARLAPPSPQQYYEPVFKSAGHLFAGLSMSRAGLVHHPSAYEWSSAAAHLHGPASERKSLLDWDYWRRCGGEQHWQALLCRPEDSRESGELRRATYAGSPLGCERFVSSLEAQFGRYWRIAGRPKKSPQKRAREAERSNSFDQVV